MAYAIQPSVIVLLAVLLRGVPWPPLAKCILVGPMAVVAIYAAARALRLFSPVRPVVG